VSLRPDRTYEVAVEAMGAEASARPPTCGLRSLALRTSATYSASISFRRRRRHPDTPDETANTQAALR
jgi:hypothetical protein